MHVATQCRRMCPVTSTAGYTDLFKLHVDMRSLHEHPIGHAHGCYSPVEVASILTKSADSFHGASDR